MNTNFNFKSQIATSRSQSERLLALGLKKETADCCYYYYDGEYLIAFAEDAKYPSDIPAWSLGRLIEILPGLIYPKEKLQSFSGYAYLNLTNIVVWYNYIDYDMEDRTLISWRGNGLFSAVEDEPNHIDWIANPDELIYDE